MDEVERSMYSSFCSAANSLSQIYTQAMNQQKVSFQAGERHSLVRHLSLRLSCLSIDCLVCLIFDLILLLGRRSCWMEFYSIGKALIFEFGGLMLLGNVELPLKSTVLILGV